MFHKIIEGVSMSSTPRRSSVKMLPSAMRSGQRYPFEVAVPDEGMEVVFDLTCDGCEADMQTEFNVRDDIAWCMVRERAELAIIPKDQPVTSLLEYAYLRGTSDFTGRSRDSYAIRGLGAIFGQPVSSAGEEQVLGLFGPQHPFYPFRGLVAVHEFSHGIQNLCFTAEDHEEWNRFYAEALRAVYTPALI